MRAWQDADSYGDRTHGARVAPVDARLAVEDLAAHDLRLEVEEGFLHQIRVDLRVLGRELFQRGLADLAQALVARLLLLDGESAAEVLLDHRGDAR